MEGFTLFRIVEELRELILGARVEKVRLAGSEALALKLSRSARHSGGKWLLLSVEPRWPRVHLVERVKSEEASPTPFLLLARKYLRGARLSAIEMLRYDRIVRFLFRRPEGISIAPEESEGDEDSAELPEDAEDPALRESILVAELFGRSANLFLLDAQGRVRERLRAREGEPRVPGEVYTAPTPSEKWDPTTLDRETFREIARRGRTLAESLARALEGFGTLYAAEVEARWHEMSSSPERLDLDSAYAAFQSVLEDLLHRSREPILYSRVPLEQIVPARASSQDVIFSVIPLVQAKGWSATRLASFSRAAEVYYDLQRRIERFRQMKATVLRHLEEQIEKRKRLEERLESDLRALGDPEQWRRWGELLLAHASRAARTESGFLVTDYYDPAQRTIEIPTSAATPQDAASEYFRRYRKARHGVQVIAERRAALAEEVERLLRAKARAEGAETLQELESLVCELGLSPPRSPSGERPVVAASKKPKRARLPGVYHFRSSDGWDILVGKSAEDNERLTFRLAAPQDIWLHAADYPGSHVIIRRAKGQPVPPRTLREAAELAAFFSHARGSHKVVVNYTERRFVSKIPRSKPGLVRVSAFRSLAVEPRVAVQRIVEDV